MQTGKYITTSRVTGITENGLKYIDANQVVDVVSRDECNRRWNVVVDGVECWMSHVDVSLSMMRIGNLKSEIKNDSTVSARAEAIARIPSVMDELNEIEALMRVAYPDCAIGLKALGYTRENLKAVNDYLTNVIGAPVQK